MAISWRSTAAGWRAEMARPLFFGELLIRLSPPGKQLIVQGRSLDLHVGGAEANVAIGLASLGHTTRMVSRVPDNALGALALSVLRGAGVDCSAVATGGERMGLYFLTPGAGQRAAEVVYDRAGSAFATAALSDFDWDAAFAGATHLHMSGITPALGPASSAMAIAAARAAKDRGLTLIFDGNYRARLWEAWDSDPRTTLSALIGMTDILFGNHRDVALLLGRAFSGDGSDRRREAADAAFEAFPNLRIIASTARQADDSDHNRIAARIDARDRFVQTKEVTVSGIVDRIGAGDAFAAGVLHVLLDDEADLERAAEAGLGLTVLKHALPGDASFHTKADLQAFLDGHRDVRR
ncbi:hypothetical protein NX02_22830 [Sphingomonas sanxanigenens DSM 19645 = NX02]|uniref:Carbohydrate kinase PfkB domain-containing protein n=2 Tax=Sphingomonas sanxanigenens TaxID=397260 RepID=W0AE65_9SPHN|nr:hypothetical protein NX02_22830 [Sphingomonas sanxanigenens DSM 19645 = NX02]